MLKLFMICSWIVEGIFFLLTIYNIHLSLIYAGEDDISNEWWDEIGYRIEFYIGPTIIGIFISMILTVSYVIYSYVLMAD